MNNIIKELKEQATEDVLGVPVLNSELFAKLIVQDCTNLLKRLTESPDNLGGNACIIGGIEEIKKHFGVE